MHYTLGIDTSGNDTVAGVVIDGVQIASEVNTSRLKRLPASSGYLPPTVNFRNHDTIPCNILLMSPTRPFPMPGSVQRS